MEGTGLKMRKMGCEMKEEKEGGGKSGSQILSYRLAEQPGKSEENFLSSSWPPEPEEAVGRDREAVGA